MKKSDSLAVSERLQAVIRAKRIPKKELAELGQITAQTMSDYLSGKTLPNAKSLINWIKNLGLDANWVLAGVGSMFRQDQTGTAATPATEPGKELLEIKTALQEIGANEEEIRQALLDYVRGGRSPRDPATGTDDDSR